ncbi:MAG: ATP-binding protein [Pseudomonadota bacterium]
MALRYDADFYTQILDAMEDMVLVKDGRSHILYANAAFRDYYGMDQEALSALIDGPQSDPDDTLQYIRDDLTVVETGESLFIPNEMVTDADGQARAFETVKSPIFAQHPGGEHEVVKTVAVARPHAMRAAPDIQERPTSREDAKAFVRPLKTLTDNFPNPMLMVDVHARVLSVSPLWKRLLGAAEPDGHRTFWDLYPELEALEVLLQTCLVKRQAVEGEIDGRGPDGELRQFQVHSAPWAHRDGLFGGAILVANDITRIHRQQTELRQANQDLLQFSYRASHDLKGPLSTMKGLAEFAAEDIEAGALAEAKDNIAKITRMLGMLEGTAQKFLALAAADRTVSEVGAINLDALLAEIIFGHQAAIREKDIEICIETGGLDVYSQTTRLRSILENLVSNAIKYSDPAINRRRIDITATAVQKRTMGATVGDPARITISDNGLGFAPADIPRAFEMFSRFNSGVEGNGLGLAIVARQVEALGGQITIEPLEKGTAFVLHLPDAVPQQHRKVAS